MKLLIACVLDAVAALISAVPLMWGTQVLAANQMIPHPLDYGTCFGMIILFFLVVTPIRIGYAFVEELDRA